MLGYKMILLTLLLGLVLAAKETVIEETREDGKSLIRLTLSSHWDENNKPVMKGKIYMMWW